MKLVINVVKTEKTDETYAPIELYRTIAVAIVEWQTESVRVSVNS